MRITKINDDSLIFSDGSFITYDHSPECCEENYADFSAISEDDMNHVFGSVDIRAKDEGFILELGTRKLWIPCRSEQNGYYSCDLEVYHYDKDCNLIKKINLDCELC